MAQLELTLLPIGTSSTSCSDYVATAVNVAKNYPGIHYELHAMGTILEGELPQLYDCVQKMQEAIFEKGVGRVYSVIKIDDRRDKPSTMNQKIQSVEEKLNDQ